MLAPALALAAAVASTDVSEQVSDEPEPRVRTLTVYVEPVSAAVVSMVGSGMYGGALFYVPMGFTVAVGPNWGVSGELAGLALVGGHGAGWGVSASAGPTWLPSGRGVDGWLVSPKLTFNITSLPIVRCLLSCPASSNNGPADFGPGVSRSFLGGVDAGYQFAPAASVSIALMFGVSAGYGYDENGSGLVTPVLGAMTTNRTQGVVWALNFAMLRVGFAR
jgi:hypothetical protein